LPSGAQLGQYLLIEAASRGGFGILYRAWDEKLNRPVAVKECFPTSICRRDPKTGIVQPHTESLREHYETAINEVYEEAQTLAGLHHARVVPVYDVFHSAGSMFYVMPWLEGGSLRDRIAAGDAISPETAQNWLLELLAALEYLHGMQVIHRDIKPSNIMFDAAGNPVLVDFGAALNRATKVDTTTQGGFSPVYASPEQVSGKGKIGPWTDLYSLAATWYELLTGTQPEPAQQRLVSDDLAPLPSGTTVLEPSIMQNLALSPEERCQSAREWQEWLQADKTPLVLVRRRRMYLLWGIPALLLGAAGIFYSGTQLAEPAAPPAPDSQAENTPIQPDEHFYQQVCEQLGLHDLAVELAQLSRQYDELRAACQSEISKVAPAKLSKPGQKVQRNSLDIDELRQEEQRTRARKNIWQKAQDELEKLRAQGDAALARLQELIYEPESVYPWQTAQELAMLKKIQPRLEEEFKPFQKEYYRAHDAVVLKLSKGY
jgi:serine/threonine protein kinase